MFCLRGYSRGTQASHFLGLGQLIIVQPASCPVGSCDRLQALWDPDKWKRTDTWTDFTYTGHCYHLPAVHRCGHSLAEPSWNRKCRGCVSPLQNECSPGCSRTYIEHIHLNENNTHAISKSWKPVTPVMTSTSGNAIRQQNLRTTK